MEGGFLPAERGIVKAPRDFGLPEFNPSIELAGLLTGTSEQVYMVRHQNIGTDAPSMRFAPDLSEESVDRCIRQPFPAILATNSQEDEGRDIFAFEDARCWTSTFEVLGHTIY
jgi:hypothetical protein